MQITGVIKVIKPIQQISATFSKREFVIETNEQYVQTIQLELHGDRVDIIDSFTEGQEVICHIGIKGREWVNPQGETKYFNTITCWRITTPLSDNYNQSAPQSQPQRSPSTAPIIPPVNEQQIMPNSSSDEEEDDQLPF